MNKLILIGNGFDLANGLKTRYDDFLVWYLNNVLKLLKPHHPFEDNLLKVSSTFRHNYPEINSINDFLIIIKDYPGIEIEYKHNFFKLLLDQLSELKWVDVECKYYSQLLALYKILEKSNIDNHSGIDDKLRKLNSCFEAIKFQLAEYLKTIDLGTIEICADIKEHFITQIKMKKNAINSNILFLTFNYTSTLETYTEFLEPDSYSINYIHGKLNDPNNPIIFGYGDEMDTYYEKIERLNTNEFLRYIKSFGYFKTKNYQNFSSFIDSNRFIVYIMGHSCGLSDRILLNSIFEHENCKGIKIFYHKKTDTENDFFEKTQEISRHFKAEKKARMRNLIVPYSNSIPLTN